HLAEAKTEESQRRLARLYETYGTRLMDEGDQFGALLWLVQALKCSKSDPGAQQVQRTRIAVLLQQHPRFVQCWFHEGKVNDVQFSRDGRLVVSASADGTARVWNVATGKPVSPALRHGADVIRAVFSPDGRSVVTASLDQTARLWDVATGRQVYP